MESFHPPVLLALMLFASGAEKEPVAVRESACEEKRPGVYGAGSGSGTVRVWSGPALQEADGRRGSAGFEILRYVSVLLQNPKYSLPLERVV